MPKYLISWNEMVFYTLEIDGESKRDALDKFHNDNYDKEDVRDNGQEWDEDSVEIEEI